MAADASGADEREPHTGLHPDALRKIASVFGDNLAYVLKAHRRVELLTNETNVIGRQNLVEAFAHLSVVFARAGEMSRDQQLEQVSFLYDHLRRVMMESFEIEVYASVAAIWNDEDVNSVGRLYDSRVAPLIRSGKLHGHITPDQLDGRLDEIREGVVTARGAKVADGNFAEWEAASRVMEDAAGKVHQLKREAGAAVDAAISMRAARHQLIIGSVLSAVLGVILTIVVTMLAG